MVERLAFRLDGFLLQLIANGFDVAADGIIELVADTLNRLHISLGELDAERVVKASCDEDFASFRV